MTEKNLHSMSKLHVYAPPATRPIRLNCERCICESERPGYNETIGYDDWLNSLT